MFAVACGHDMALPICERAAVIARLVVQTEDPPCLPDKSLFGEIWCYGIRFVHAHVGPMKGAHITHQIRSLQVCQQQWMLCFT